MPRPGRQFGRWLWAGLLCGFTIVVVAGCGFQPLHGHKDKGRAAATGNTLSDMAYVRVAPIPDRVGQLVSNHLRDRMQPNGEARHPVFRLSTTLSENREGLAFQQDDSATRYNLRLSAHFVLTDSRDGTELLQGTFRAIAAYNVVRSDYANLVSLKDARRRAAYSVAEGIESRIAVYFSRRRE